MQNLQTPVAVTVSTNYSDILPLVLEANRGLFHHWFIVTDPRDSETVALLKNEPDITQVDFDFQADYYTAEGVHLRPSFNKGGGLARAQKLAHALYPNYWYLLLDTDICIRSARDIAVAGLDPTKIYGVRSRKDYSGTEAYNEANCYLERRMWQEPHEIIGFFQLYHWNQRRLYPNTQTTQGDEEFANLWARKNQDLLNITVDHLGHWPPDTLPTHHGRPFGQGWLG